MLESWSETEVFDAESVAQLMGLKESTLCGCGGEVWMRCVNVAK